MAEYRELEKKRDIPALKKAIGLVKAFLGYTYTDIVKMYARAGYQVCMKYFMAEKAQ